jgi:hypothetical protein
MTMTMQFARLQMTVHPNVHACRLDNGGYIIVI